MGGEKRMKKCGSSVYQSDKVDEKQKKEQERKRNDQIES